ncbi:hypothetical protein [Heliobacterium mobile]|uniref:hypothetical protein n=1 Tax=Heliobacterium mobile TaxID=28064 RepID=UPI0012D73D6E|nr:hypothetical protein [Heliobacterium mobile]
MSYQPSNPIIVQGDFSLLLEVDNPLFEIRLGRFHGTVGHRIFIFRIENHLDRFTFRHSPRHASA